MKKFFYTVLVLLSMAAQSQIKGPESITYCHNTGKYYVSSAKSGEIFSFEIKNGKAVNFDKIAEGLNFPRGMFAQNGKIYVTEAPAKTIREIDAKTGKTVKNFNLPKSTDQNDILVYQDEIYASDLRGNTIWRINIKTGKSVRFASIDKPNGLAVKNGKLWCITFSSSAKIYSFDIKTGEKENEYSIKNMPYGDGLQIVNNKFLCTSWGKNYSEGKVFVFDPESGKTNVILDHIKGPADLFAGKNGNIIIPLMTENRIIVKKIEL